jgi:hypothetical protein
LAQVTVEVVVDLCQFVSICVNTAQIGEFVSSYIISNSLELVELPKPEPGNLVKLVNMVEFPTELLNLAKSKLSKTKHFCKIGKVG